MRLVVIAALSCLVFAGCADRTIAEVDTSRTGQVQKDIPVSTAVDLLFVIDNSSSTQDKQDVFAANFRNFVDALDRFPGGRPNLHIGVVSTTVDNGPTGIGGCPSPAPDDDGRFHAKPFDATCSGPSGRFIVDVERPGGGRDINYDGARGLASTFECIARIGAGGCGFEAPLEAMKRALDGSRPENAGFLRPGAFLVVVFLVDEDDASLVDPAAFFAGATQQSDFNAQPLTAYQCDRPLSTASPASYTNCRPRTDSQLIDPAEYVAFLSTLKPPGRSVAAVIGGDPDPNIRVGRIELPAGTQDPALLESCEAQILGRRAVGRPALRMASFLEGFGDHGLFRSVCQADYSQTLADIGALVGDVISPCLEGSIDARDLDPAPGTQLDCTVSDVQIEPAFVETVVPRCPMADDDTPSAGGPRPCWWATPAPAACAAFESKLELHVERATPAPLGTDVRVRCATQPGT